jgi:hypothetical protein
MTILARAGASENHHKRRAPLTGASASPSTQWLKRVPSFSCCSSDAISVASNDAPGRSLARSR